MNESQLDEKITGYIGSIVSQAIHKNHKCISNSLILPSKQGSHLVYFAKDNSEGLVFVTINISKDEQQNTIKIYPAKMDSSVSLDNMVLEFSECPYMPGVFAIMAFDPREKTYNIEKHVFLANIMIDELAAIQNGKNQSLNFYNINAHKKIGNIKDMKWYPFAAMTLLILTESRILIYDLEQITFDPSFEINLKDFQVVNANEVTKKDQFEKIGFAQKLSQDDQYSSLGKKLCLYLASSSGAVYMLFPFVSYKIILDEVQNQSLQNLKNSKSQLKKQQRELRIASIFQSSQLIPISSQSEQNREKHYNLYTQRPTRSKPQIFKLITPSFTGKQSFQPLANPVKKIQIFQPLTINQHTLFMLGTRLKNNQYDLKTMIFSADPYQLLLKSINQTADNFNVEIINEIKLDQGTETEKVTYGNGLQIKVPKMINNTEVYLMHDNMTCYRLAMIGLERFLSKKEEQRSTDKDLRLIDVDVVFESKHKIMTLTVNDLSIFVLKNYNNNYLYESIPLKSLELKEKIINTIKQTQELFKELAAKSKKHKVNIQDEKKINLQEIKSSPLSEIEQKMKTFSQDYRKSVENKLAKIKKLYELILTKKSQLDRQQSQKAEMIKLVNEAEANQEKIKQLFNKQKTYTSSTQKNIQRRILGASNMLDQIKTKIEREREEVRKDSEKMDFMEQCVEQTDGVIKKLQELKKQLIDKRQKLRKELGLEDAGKGY